MCIGQLIKPLLMTKSRPISKVFIQERSSRNAKNKPTNTPNQTSDSLYLNNLFLRLFQEKNKNTETNLHDSSTTGAKTFRLRGKRYRRSTHITENTPTKNPVIISRTRPAESVPIKIQKIIR